jgi:nitrogen fixation NifU-like protein
LLSLKVLKVGMVKYYVDKDPSSAEKINGDTQVY